MRADWQTLVTLAIGALAAAYLARRWWPGLKGLFGAQAAAPAQPDARACGATVAAPAASCASGCGNCGQSTTPARDHRVHITRGATH